MPISSLKALELGLVENLCKRELENPEGVGLDLRVGEVYKITGNGFLGIKDKRTPLIERIAKYDPSKLEVIIMKPGDYFLVKTMETINVPSKKIIIEEGLPPRYLMPQVFPRSTLQRCEISLYATKTDPGYHGQLVFGIKNESREHEFSFELGARMFNIVFHSVIGEIDRSYSGQNQGGRVTSGGKIEVQN